MCFVNLDQSLDEEGYFELRDDFVNVLSTNLF